MDNELAHPTTDDRAIDLSFVVIAFNEAASLRACLDAVMAARPTGLCCEILFVDGGSTDGSVEIARAAGVDRVLGGETRRRAAENRNLGWRAAKGAFVQFVDGDMALDPQWPREALALMETHADVAVVFGELREVRDNAFYRALQIDWQYPEGDALYCGGAALFRRDALEKAGGFPEDVRHGEEPLLCWRLRNDHGCRVWHRHALMARHDLAYTGFPDYWRRNVRVGETYAEIAALLKNTSEPFWTRECAGILRWAGILLGGLLVILFAPRIISLATLLLAAALIIRKTLQTMRRGHTAGVGILYALHTYFSKLGGAWGILRHRFGFR